MESEVKQLLQMAIGAITAAGGLKVLVPRFMAWLDARRERDAIREHEGSLLRMRQVQSMLSELRHGLRADRVALVRVSNGGATPRPSAPLNVQTLFESAVEPSPTGRIFWLRQQRADGALIGSTAQLGEGPLVLDTSEMEGGMLKTLAEGLDCERVLMTRVRISPRSSCILMVFLEGTDDLGPGQRLLLEQLGADIGAKL